MPADNFFKYLLLKLRRFCGFLCGFVFFISGILKLMDPVGAGLVMKEYLDFLHIGFLSWAAKGLGVGFALLETIIGTALITGVWRKLTAIVAWTLQGFFTVLTLILVIFNPVMDCGCFGEAIHLSHLQTFIKNIILCALLSFAFIPLRNLGRPKPRKFVSFGIVTVSVLAFTVYSLMYIPLDDFTDFKPGVGLEAAAEGDGGAEVYESVFVYEKDGRQQEFSLEELPDSTWTYVSTSTIKKSGTDRARASLSFYDLEGEYKDSLATEGNVMIISIYKEKLSEKKWARMRSFISAATDAGFTPIILTSSAAIAAQGDSNGAKTYLCDYKTLITMNRSNGGASWFSQGYLIKKWGIRSLPDGTEMKEIISGNPTETVLENYSGGNLLFQGFLLYVFAVMLLL